MFDPHCRLVVRTGSFVKNGGTSEPNALTCSGTLASRAGQQRPGGEHGATASEGQLYRAAAASPGSAQTGSHRHRIPGERARLVDRPRRRDQRHDVCTPAIGATGSPPPMIFQAREIGAMREDRLRHARRRAKAGDYLIENRRLPFAVHRSSQPSQKAVRGR